MIRKGELTFGDIVWVEFDPSVGHEFQHKRPAVVVQSDEQIKRSNLVTVIPLTSNVSNVVADDILIAVGEDNHLRSDSVLKVYCITSFDYSRFDKKIGTISLDVQRKVKAYLKRHFEL